MLSLDTNRALFVPTQLWAGWGADKLDKLSAVPVWLECVQERFHSHGGGLLCRAIAAIIHVSVTKLHSRSSFVCSSHASAYQQVVQRTNASHSTQNGSNVSPRHPCFHIPFQLIYLISPFFCSYFSIISLLYNAAKCLEKSTPFRSAYSYMPLP